jgi:hypothetical protein
VRRETFFESTTAPQVFHELSTRFPHNGFAERRATIRAAVVTLALALAGASVVRADAPIAAAAPAMYRVFLTDGTSVATVGEFARTGDRVVVTLGLADRLTVTTLAAGDVDWERTNRYTEAVRAGHYAETRGETDFAAMSAVVARTLSDVAITPGPANQLALAERARTQLAAWPRDHFNYRADEVRQTLALLDEVIAGLRAAAGQTRFDLALVATVLPPPTEPVLPPPTLQESIEQALRLSARAVSSAERTALADEARTVLAAAPAAPWVGAARTRVDRLLEDERRVDQHYARLTASAVRDLDRRARASDVSGLLRVRARVVDRDAALGRLRPESVQALLATIDARLDAARRLQLARDQWATRAAVLRHYRRDVTPWFDLLAEHRRTLEEIKALAGPAPERLAAVQRALARLAPLLKSVDVPVEARAVHASIIGALGLTDTAARTRTRAIDSQSLPVAWEASAAAAGALLMVDRAGRDLAALLAPPAAP